MERKPPLKLSKEAMDQAINKIWHGMDPIRYYWIAVAKAEITLTAEEIRQWHFCPNSRSQFIHILDDEMEDCKCPIYKEARNKELNKEISFGEPVT